MVENWAQLLAILGFIITFRWVKEIAEQLRHILIELRDVNKDTSHLLRVINEEIQKNTEAMDAVHSAVTGADHTLSESLQVLYRIEDELSPASPPYLAPTGDRL
jgi:hypothetical protein